MRHGADAQNRHALTRRSGGLAGIMLAIMGPDYSMSAAACATANC